ncbi:MAG: hypothetical protein HZA94_03120 [Candidatus Vogelbacteria bacterium]|nr:hypothetical protein [Candidatus Vogelbacteria bacterium]
MKDGKTKRKAYHDRCRLFYNVLLKPTIVGYSKTEVDYIFCAIANYVYNIWRKGEQERSGMAKGSGVKKLKSPRQCEGRAGSFLDSWIFDRIWRGVASFPGNASLHSEVRDTL